MLSMAGCRSIAKDKLSELFTGAALYDAPIHSGDYGWVFSYQSKQYMRSGDLREMLIGNSPILVDRYSGAALVLGSGLAVEAYVENYLACGDPFKFLGRKVELCGWETGAKKIDAIKIIRLSTQLGLAAAKQCVDGCLDGKISLLSARLRRMQRS
jgi:hypothetical protein